MISALWSTLGQLVCGLSAFIFSAVCALHMSCDSSI